MPVRHDDPRPPYVQLADELRQAIAGGEYEPGDRLPSQRKLAYDNRIAENTVRHAFEVLAEEGLVVAQHGRGVFVQEPKPGADDAEARPKTLEESLAEALRDLDEANELLARYEAAGVELPESAPEAAPGVEPPGVGV
jgi:GntR family transcriptional regulator